MTLLGHELRSNRTSLWIWCGVVCAMTMLTMLLYPSFKDQMDSISVIFSMMGPFTAALGLDVLPLGSAIGFYGIETGTMLAVGGTMFAAYTGIGMLSKEEGSHTAEFLLTQPVSRTRIVTEKLLALCLLLVVFNAVSAGVGLLCFALIGEAVPMGTFLLFHLAQLLLHIEIGCICFGLSALSQRPQIGLGLGIALLLYFLSLLVNMVDALGFLRYVTPFTYADAATIFTKSRIDPLLLCIGVGVSALSIWLAYLRFGTKDIEA